MKPIELAPGFWWLMAGYGLLLIGMSLYFTRMVKSSDDMYLGSRQLPPWFNGLSYLMTAFSASVFVANASLAYRHGALNALLILAQLPVFIAGYTVFSARWHRTGCQTAIEFLEKRFGENTARFYVAIGIPMRILENANRVYVTAVLCEAMFGMTLLTGALVTVGASLLSTVGGGFFAIVVTDAVQAVLLTLIVAVVAAFSWDRVGGWSGFAASVPDNYWSLEGSDGFGLSMIVVWSFVALFVWNGSWSLVQRFVAVPSEREARQVTLVAGISYYILFPLIAIPPMAAVLLVPGLQTSQQAEYAYILAAEKVLPSGLMAMLCFGLLSGTITGLNSEFNVVAQVMVHDIGKRRLARYSESARLWVGRCLMVIMSGFCLVLALRIREMGGAFKFLITLFGMTTLPTFVPLLLGLLWRRATARGAIGAFVAGIATSIVLQFVLQWSLVAVIVANGAVTTAVFLLSALWPERDPERGRQVDALFARLRRSSSGSAKEEVDHGYTRAVARIAAITLIIAGFLSLAAEILTAEASRGRGAAAVIAVALFAIGGAVYFRNRPPREKANRG